MSTLKSKSKFATFFVGLILFGGITNVDAKSLDYIAVLDEGCKTKTAIQQLESVKTENLTEHIIKISVADDREIETLKQSPCIESVELDKKVRKASYNDPYYELKWYLHNTGQELLFSTGLNNIDIDFPEAQSKLTTKEVKVAVIDTGVDEIAELTGKVLTGYNFVDDNTNTDDVDGHGTFMASMISSKSNNSSGIVGLYEPAKILPVKVLADDGYGFMSDIIAGIDYAISQNAKVLNLSLGGGYSSALNTVIEKAYNQNIIVVAASGNDGMLIDGNNRQSPVGNDGDANWVIGVGSHDNQGNVSDFSNFGSSVDILAPGEEIVGVGVDNIVGVVDGTSIATAIVAGVIAAWEGYYGDLTPSQVHLLLDNYSKQNRINLNDGLISQNLPDGTLLKSTNSGVYLLDNGLKHPITSPEIFLSYNWRWSEIVTVSQSELNSIKDGTVLSMRDGMLVADRGSVYIVENGTKRPIASAQVFLGLGLSWNNVTYPGDMNLNQLPTGPLVSSTTDLTNGMVVVAPGHPVYLIQNGKRHPILDPYIYTSYFRWEELQNVSESVIRQYPVGETVIPQEGEIIADQNSVYIVTKGQRRPFANEKAYIGRGFRWDSVIFPSPFVHSLLPKGDLIR